MRGGERHVEKEGLLGGARVVGAEPLFRIVREDVGRVAGRAHGDAVAAHHGSVGGRILDMVEIVHAAAERVERVVEAMAVGREGVLIAEVPFAGEGGGVAAVAQQAGDRDFGGGQAELALRGQANRVVVAADAADPDGALQAADALLITSGEKSGAGG